MHPANKLLAWLSGNLEPAACFFVRFQTVDLWALSEAKDPPTCSNNCEITQFPQPLASGLQPPARPAPLRSCRSVYMTQYTTVELLSQTLRPLAFRAWLRTYPRFCSSSASKPPSFAPTQGSPAVSEPCRSPSHQPLSSQRCPETTRTTRSRGKSRVAGPRLP